MISEPAKILLQNSVCGCLCVGHIHFLRKKHQLSPNYWVIQLSRDSLCSSVVTGGEKAVKLTKFPQKAIAIPKTSH